MGLRGSFTIKVSGLTGDNPRVEVLNTNLSRCYDFSDLPYSSSTEFVPTSNVTEYTPMSGIINAEYVKIDFTDYIENDEEESDEDTQEDEGQEGQEGQEEQEEQEEQEGQEELSGDDVKTKLTITFQLPVRKQECYFALPVPNGKREYVWGDLLVKRDSSTNGTTFQNIIPVTDFDKYRLGTVKMATMNFITNMGEVDTPEQYEFKDILFEVGPNGVESDGRFAPTSLQVIDPNATPSTEGDVYDRFYRSEASIYVRMATIGDEFSDERWLSMFTLDNSATKKSIRLSPTNRTYLGLTRTANNQCLDEMPSGMIEKIEKLTMDKLKLEDSQFTSMLSQLNMFLKSIEIELLQDVSNGTWSTDAICSLCQFGYDATIRYNAHSTEDAMWADVNLGLFGYNRGSEQYERCLTQLNQAMYEQFYNDFSPIECNEVQLSNGGNALRDYFHILFGEYALPTSTKIVEFRENALSGLYARLNHVNQDGDLID